MCRRVKIVGQLGTTSRRGQICRVTNYDTPLNLLFTDIRTNETFRRGYIFDFINGYVGEIKHSTLMKYRYNIDR